MAAAAIDGVTGEMLEAKLTPAHDHIRGWLQDLPGPVAVAYEPGPAGVICWRELQIEAMVRLDQLDEAAKALAPFEDRAAGRSRASDAGLLGVGPDHAAQLLITAGGNSDRLRSEAAFAALYAASPIQPAAARPTVTGSIQPATETPIARST